MRCLDLMVKQFMVTGHLRENSVCCHPITWKVFVLSAHVMLMVKMHTRNVDTLSINVLQSNYKIATTQKKHAHALPSMPPNQRCSPRPAKL